MKLSFYLLLNVLVLLSAVVSAAPVGNIGAPLLWGEGFLVRKGRISITTSLDFDLQKIHLPDQLHRIAWDDPDISGEEVRHYEQVRSSRNEFLTSGLSIGAAIDKLNIVYLMLGTVNSKIDLSYSDRTIYYDFSTNAKFRGNNDFYYGLGWSGILHEGVFMEETPVRFGMDAKYRKLEMKDNDLSGSGHFYSTSLDEFQLAFILSAEVNNLFPYCGFRISSVTGREHFIELESTDGDGNDVTVKYYGTDHIDYRRDISWFKDTGYLAGISYYFKELVIVNLEYRSGDEEGIGLSTTVKF